MAIPQVIEIRKKIDRFFEGLNFIDSSHSYYYGGHKRPSVSSFVSSASEYVDFKEKAEIKAKREGTTQAEILKVWDKKRDDSIVRGKATHDYAEKGFHEAKKPSTKQEEAIADFLGSLPLHLHIVGKEIKMVHKHWLYCGTTDLILYNELTDKCIVADYKTNEDLFKNFRGKTLLPPFDFLFDNPYNKYQIQFGLYQLLFEQLRIDVSERWLIWTRPEGGWQKFDIIDLQTEILSWLQAKS